MIRTIIIFNPWANRGKARKAQTHLQKLCERYGCKLALTQKAGDARRLAAEAAREGYDIVAAAGGDGTVHEVVNGLCQVKNISTRLGILPIGSGNDLAHGLGISKRLDLAFRQMVQGHPKAIDLAKIEDENGRFAYADNNLGIGFDAQVVIQAESIQWSGGFFLYLLATLQTLLNNFYTLPLDIQFDDEHIQQPTLFLALGLGFRGGGGFQLTPDASHEDNLIDSCLVSEIGRLTALTLLPSAINGGHVKASYVAMRKNRCITITSSSPMPIHVDGELFAYPKDNIKQVTITSVPAAIEVMVPKP